MEVIIQHNLKAGLGDFTNGMYRYVHLVDKMKENGFEKIGLYVNMSESIMFDKNFFFVLYNKSLLDKIFDNIQISDVQITSTVHNGLSLFCPHGNNQTGVNQFDIFINQTTPHFNYFKNNCFSHFFEEPKTKFVNFFSDYVMERYEKMNIHKNEDYKSLHFRAKDTQDNVELYIDHEEEFKEVIFNKGKIFVSSNSYEFKEYIKSFNSPNVFMYDLQFEKQFGNHLSKLIFNSNFGKKEYEDKAIEAAVESLTISDSNEVFSFNFFGNVHSNFLNFAKWKSKDIRITALKNGMNWNPSMI
jgi:hypothetical protein